MKALLIAGGFGTRLRPLTLTRPKHLLPIVNRPHLEHVYDLLQQHGVSELVLLTSYLADTFEPSVRVARERGLQVHVTHEEEPLGTAGAIKNAQDVVGDDTFFAFNGDILTAADLTALVRWHREREAEATILLTPVDDPSAYGVVPTAGDGRVNGFIEKPPPGEAPTNLINAGVYLFEPSVLDRIPEGRVYSAERELFPSLVDEQAALFATPTDAYWMDIGTPAKYLQANLDALSGAFPSAAVEDPGGAEVLVHPAAEVAEDCELQSVVVGAGARVGTGTVLERVVLLPGATVGEGAALTDCVLGEESIVAAGATLRGRTLGDRERADAESEEGEVG